VQHAGAVDVLEAAQELRVGGYGWCVCVCVCVCVYVRRVSLHTRVHTLVRGSYVCCARVSLCARAHGHVQGHQFALDLPLSQTPPHTLPHLVCEVADVVLAQGLGAADDLVQICVHEVIHQVHVPGGRDIWAKMSGLRYFPGFRSVSSRQVNASGSVERGGVWGWVASGGPGYWKGGESA
jgi:hypothetical protein